MSITSYKDLIVWQKAMELVVVIYRLTENFPINERFGLSSQMRMSAVSIASNIAEGSRRGTRKDFHQFIIIAFGSGAELETQVEIVKRLKLNQNVSIALLENLLQEVMKMLNKLEQSLS